MIVFICFIVAMMAVFALRLYKLQTAELVTADADSMTYRTMEASRGNILDRNGNVLVSNRASYNLVIINFVLTNTGATNENLLKLLDLCDQRGIEYESHFPVTMERPYAYQMDGISSTWQDYFRAFLRNREYDLDTTASTLMKKLRAVCKKMVVVLSCGSAVETDWAQDCDALLYAGLGGEAVARSVLRALVGEITPGGKLAETWYRHYADAPVSHYYPGTEATSEYREGLYVGYRYTESADVAPAFAFGHGLSYTTYRYDNVQADAKGVSFDVTNTGDCAGDEVAQLYIHKPNAEVFRPAKELKGFQRVHLEKGETKRVTIPFDGYTFRYFNVRTNRFEVEGGEYELLIGASCRDIRLTAKHTEQGTSAPNPYAQLAVQSYRTARVTDVSDAEFAALLGHAIPPHLWDKTQPLTLNDTVTQLSYAKNPLARLIYRILTRMKNKATAAGKPDLNLLFIYNIPFRGMAKMMNGMVSMAMAEDMLLMVNGHFFRGCGRLIHHFCHRPKLNLNPDKKKK